ncbi:hypothetical protein VNO77_23184 [Canavalia gladiata]|uniref:Uncharacterized protein n=1 Tax=Canavalia gladiata TaxID=3824 RepID=A0AAN9L4I1_CANGL
MCDTVYNVKANEIDSRRNRELAAISLLRGFVKDVEYFFFEWRKVSLDFPRCAWLGEDLKISIGSVVSLDFPRCAWLGEDLKISIGSVVSKKEGLISLIAVYECEIFIDPITETTYGRRRKRGTVGGSGVNFIINLATMDVEIMGADAGNRGTHMEVPISEDLDDMSWYEAVVLCPIVTARLCSMAPDKRSTPSAKAIFHLILHEGVLRLHPLRTAKELKTVSLILLQHTSMSTRIWFGRYFSSATPGRFQCLNFQTTLGDDLDWYTRDSQEMISFPLEKTTLGVHYLAIGAFGYFSAPTICNQPRKFSSWDVAPSYALAPKSLVSRDHGAIVHLGV